MRFVGKFHRDASSRLCLQLISETYTKLQKAETPPWESHRPGIGLENPCRPPLMVETKKGGRPTRKPGRQTTFCLLDSGFSATKARRRESKVFSTYVCATTPPRPCTSSRKCGPRSSGHQPRISMHDGQGVELHVLMWHESTNTHLRPTLHHGKFRMLATENRGMFRHLEYETSLVSRAWTISYSKNNATSNAWHVQMRLACNPKCNATKWCKHARDKMQTCT